MRRLGEVPVGCGLLASRGRSSPRRRSWSIQRGEQWQWYSGKAGKILAEIAWGAATTPPRYNAKPLEVLAIQQR
jgi:hypothetical protein